MEKQTIPKNVELFLSFILYTCYFKMWYKDVKYECTWYMVNVKMFLEPMIWIVSAPQITIFFFYIQS